MCEFRSVPEETGVRDGWGEADEECFALLGCRRAQNWNAFYLSDSVASMVVRVLLGWGGNLMPYVGFIVPKSASDIL